MRLWGIMQRNLAVQIGMIGNTFLLMRCKWLLTGLKSQQYKVWGLAMEVVTEHIVVGRSCSGIIKVAGSPDVHFRVLQVY